MSEPANRARRGRWIPPAAPVRSVGCGLGATILGATFGRVVAGDRPRLAVSARGDAARLDALLEQVVAHRLGAALGELLVVRGAADRVGVPFDDHVEARIVAQ